MQNLFSSCPLCLCRLKECLSSNVSQIKTDCEMMPSYELAIFIQKRENLYLFIFYPYHKNHLNKKEKVFLSFLYLQRSQFIKQLFKRFS